MRLRATGIAILAAVVIAGCGGSSGGGTTTFPPVSGGAGGTPTGIVTNATLAVGGNSHHYVTATGPIIAVHGYIKTRSSAANSATKWIQLQKLTGSYAQKELALMNRDGFKIGVAEDLWLARKHIATVVQEYAASVGSTDALALETSRLTAEKGAKRFTVPGVLGAIGYKVAGQTEIAFGIGHYYVQFTRNATGKAAVAQMAGIAKTIYGQLPI